MPLHGHSLLQPWMLPYPCPPPQLGGVDGTGCEFLQAAAEDVPRPDGSFDVVGRGREGIGS